MLINSVHYSRGQHSRAHSTQILSHSVSFLFPSDRFRNNLESRRIWVEGGHPSGVGPSGVGYSIHPSEVKNSFSEGFPKGEARGTAG